jgi:hypothetical protein
MMLSTARNPRLVILPLANPAWRLTFKDSAVFQWGRPEGMAQDSLQLRFYWSGIDDGEITWEAGWRWTAAIRPGEDVNPPATSLGMQFTDVQSLRMKSFRPADTGEGEASQLHVSEPVHLHGDNLGNGMGDYVQVSITFAGANGFEIAFLLMAELTWKTG